MAALSPSLFAFSLLQDPVSCSAVQCVKTQFFSNALVVPWWFNVLLVWQSPRQNGNEIELVDVSLITGKLKLIWHLKEHLRRVSALRQCVLLKLSVGVPVQLWGRRWRAREGIQGTCLSLGCLQGRPSCPTRLGRWSAKQTLTGCFQYLPPPLFPAPGSPSQLLGDKPFYLRGSICNWNKKGPLFTVFLLL